MHEDTQKTGSDPVLSELAKLAFLSANAEQNRDKMKEQLPRILDTLRDNRQQINQKHMEQIVSFPARLLDLGYYSQNTISRIIKKHAKLFAVEDDSSKEMDLVHTRRSKRTNNGTTRHDSFSRVIEFLIDLGYESQYEFSKRILQEKNARLEILLAIVARFFGMNMNQDERLLHMEFGELRRVWDQGKERIREGIIGITNQRLLLVGTKQRRLLSRGNVTYTLFVYPDIEKSRRYAIYDYLPLAKMSRMKLKFGKMWKELDVGFKDIHRVEASQLSTGTYMTANKENKEIPFRSSRTPHSAVPKKYRAMGVSKKDSREITTRLFLSSFKDQPRDFLKKRYEFFKETLHDARQRI
ncbi:MAG: hypothetical protein ACFFER_17145 [Candidatus Thorarchaeota archaeon]